jgi:hypothetical protein
MASIEATQRFNVFRLHHAGALAEGVCTTLQIDPRAGLEGDVGCLRLVREGGVR